jgi:ABC transporter with metal-binding/Fe-S-binding domain ATP-binding protein
MRIAVLFSGGKDSCYATYLASKKYNVVCLITAVPERDDSWMFHVPCVGWANMQAKSMDKAIEFFSTSGKKEKELDDLQACVEEIKIRFDIRGLVSGAIASRYQKDRIDSLCRKLKLKHIAPLWGMDEERLLKDIIRLKFETIVVGVAAEGLDESWLGRRIDSKAVTELKKLKKKYDIHIAGEGGELETFVLNCPLFKKPLKVIDSEKVWQGNSGYLDIKEIDFA